MRLWKKERSRKQIVGFQTQSDCPPSHWFCSWNPRAPVAGLGNDVSVQRCAWSAAVRSPQARPIKECSLGRRAINVRPGERQRPFAWEKRRRGERQDSILVSRPVELCSSTNLPALSLRQRKTRRPMGANDVPHHRQTRPSTGQLPRSGVANNTRIDLELF